MDVWFLSRGIEISFGRDGECVREEEGEKDMKRGSKRIFRYWMLVLLSLITYQGWAVDVKSAEELKNALGGKATVSGNTVTLTGDVDISSSLRIVESTMILDLNGKKITYDRSGIKAAPQNDIAIEVNGSTANLTVKNGTIIVKAANGEDNGWNTKGGNGSNASAVVLEQGSVSVLNIDLNATPGNGGSGQNFFGKPNPGSAGSAWVIDANHSYTLGDMVPSGAYFSEPANVDYNTKDGGINLSKAVVRLSSYIATYNSNGGTLSNTISPYTIETYTNPTGSRTGYTFDGLTPKTSGVTYVNGIPVLETRSAEGTIEFEAKWIPIPYTIYYKDNAETQLSTSTYTIENEVTSFAPFPTQDNAIFDGWYEDQACTKKVTSIPLGSTGEKTFYGQWFTKHTITYDCGDKDVTLPDNAVKEFHKKTATFNLPANLKRTGYNFNGWKIKDDASGETYTKVETNTFDKDLTFTASWTPKEYTAKFYLEEGAKNPFEEKKYTIESKTTFPAMDSKKDHYEFTGNWKYNGNLVQSLPYPDDEKVPVSLYAVWKPLSYYISFDVQASEVITPSNMEYSVETEGLALPKNLKRTGYTFKEWCKDKDCTQSFGTAIPIGTNGNFTLYAKWEATKYAITYNTYSDVNLPSSTYTIEDEVTLPVPQRDAYSFASWYESDRLEGASVMAIAKGTTGNKTFYAKWSAGSVVTISQGANGSFTVKNGDKEVKSGEYVGAGLELTLTAAPVAPYTLSKWVVNGKDDITGNPAKVKMPVSGGLAISAVFADNRTAVSAPEIITTPTSTDKVPKGESVKVKLNKTDESATLYYSLDGAPEKAYTGEFLASSAKDTLIIKAIARKSGYKDGVTTRQVVFDNNKITLTFDLPSGVKATNPTGGDVVTATTTGGSFEFALTVDTKYYTNLDSMIVSANDSVIRAGSGGLYTLTDCSSDVTVTVAGLKAKTCTVTLKQTENGTISFTDGAEETTTEVEYGGSVSITAKPDEDFKFLQWSTGSQSNPLKLTVTRDTTVSARFISDYKAYAVTLPELQGVKVKPFSGFSTEVKKGESFKFYLQLASGYREENLVVCANGEELVKNKGGYAIFNVNTNISISVAGIVRDPVTLDVPENVNAKVVETMADISKEGVYEETMVLLHAEAPAGKVFSKWTDGKTDNPRMATALDAAQLVPLFVNKGNTTYAKVVLNQSAGAGITAVNANTDAVKSDETVQLRVVLLPAYSQSEVILTADGKELSPETSLRAATETKTYLYTLPALKDGMTVSLSGLKLNTYNVTAVQTTGGTIAVSPSGKVTHGDKIQLKAEPQSGMLFIKWWDGNTLNPYPYTVTSDTEVKAYFLGEAVTVENESIKQEDKVQIDITGQTLSISVTEESMTYIWDYKGSLYRSLTVPSGGCMLDLPAGVYLVRVGDIGVKKIIVR